MDQEATPTVKVALVGSQSVGKTSIVKVLNKMDFNTAYKPTIAGAFTVWNTKVDNRDVKIHVWDTAGQERYRSLTPSYYRDANYIILVYDITEHDSFNDLKGWYDEVCSNCLSPPHVTIVGNKIDLRAPGCVTTEDGESIAESMNADFSEVSAKVDDGSIKTVFQMIADHAVTHRIGHAEQVVKPATDIEKKPDCC